MLATLMTIAFAAAAVLALAVIAASLAKGFAAAVIALGKTARSVRPPPSRRETGSSSSLARGPSQAGPGSIGRSSS